MDKPEALRLADELDQYLYSVPAHPLCTDAAAELRRLSAVETQRDALLETLKWLDRWMSDKTMPECRWKVRGTIEAVEGENHAKSL